MVFLNLIVTIVLIGLAFYVIWWALGKIQLGEPWDKIIVVLWALAIVVVVIGLLTGKVPVINVIK